jgi:hypothetical protein
MPKDYCKEYVKATDPLIIKPSKCFSIGFRTVVEGMKDFSDQKQERLSSSRGLAMDGLMHRRSILPCDMAFGMRGWLGWGTLAMLPPVMPREKIGGLVEEIY